MNDSNIVKEEMKKESNSETKSEDSVEIVREQLIRLAADFDNYRKRVAKNLEQDRKRIKGEVIIPFLDVIDSVRAAKNAEYKEASEILEGLATLNKQIGMITENQGVLKIEGKGINFDSRLHEAVGTVEGDSAEMDKIVEIVKEGYLLDGEILRTAKVIVSKQTEKKNGNKKV